MQLSVAYNFLPKRPSANASIVMDHFGIGFETGRHVIAADLELPIEPGDVVCFTGASGSGKSSLLRAVVDELRGAPTDHGQGTTDTAIVDVSRLDPANRILIDALGLPAPEAMQLLSACGLGEAQLMLRAPQELSDGQRYRFRLALALARRPRWIVADEFTATLDRALAKVIAHNIRRLADRTGTGFLLATTHEDILEDLQPSLHVVCRLDGRIESFRASVGQVSNLPGGVTEFHSVRPTNGRSRTPSYGSQPAAKKKRSASSGGCSSPPAPVATGRTLLGGITADTTSEPCDS